MAVNKGPKIEMQNLPEQTKFLPKMGEAAVPFDHANVCPARLRALMALEQGIFDIQPRMELRIAFEGHEPVTGYESTTPTPCKWCGGYFDVWRTKVQSQPEEGDGHGNGTDGNDKSTATSKGVN